MMFATLIVDCPNMDCMEEFRVEVGVEIDDGVITIVSDVIRIPEGEPTMSKAAAIARGEA